jgi:hypothetical protein
MRLGALSNFYYLCLAILSSATAKGSTEGLNVTAHLQARGQTQSHQRKIQYFKTGPYVMIRPWNPPEVNDFGTPSCTGKSARKWDCIGNCRCFTAGEMYCGTDIGYEFRSSFRHKKLTIHEELEAQSRLFAICSPAVCTCSHLRRFASQETISDAMSSLHERSVPQVQSFEDVAKQNSGNQPHVKRTEPYGTPIKCVGDRSDICSAACRCSFFGKVSCGVDVGFSPRSRENELFPENIAREITERWNEHCQPRCMCKVGDKWV